MPIFERSFIDARQQRSSRNLDDVLSSGDLVLVHSGRPIQKPGGLDQNYPFLPHPDYYWVTGSRRARGIAAYAKDTGWISFVEPTSAEEILWEGGRDAPEGRPLSELPAWISKLSPARVIALGQPSPQEGSLYGDPLAVEAQARIQEAFNRARRIKDAAEIALVERAARAAHAGYKRLKEILAPGVSERRLQLEYEHAALMAGADGFPYDSLVGAGANSAILHAVPTEKILKEGELVLVDAGAEIHEYGVDITRSYAVGGRFDARQKSVYDLVHAAQKAAIALCRPGVEWLDVHEKAARVLADGLKDLGLLKGSVDALVESGAVSVFFPHGIGHMVGLRVRDVGPRVGAPLRTRSGVRVRVDLPLEEGFLMTVEPGLYFVGPMLDDPKLRDKHRDTVAWEKIDVWKDFGGIRIEDDILVTSGEPRNLTIAVEKA